VTVFPWLARSASRLSASKRAAARDQRFVDAFRGAGDRVRSGALRVQAAAPFACLPLAFRRSMPFVFILAPNYESVLNLRLLRTWRTLETILLDWCVERE
jgi:hypothetical protein